MNYIFIGIVFILFLFLQGSVLSMPLLLLFFLFMYVHYRQDWVFLFAFLAGICLDSISVREIGWSSTFFLVFLFCVFLYQRRFEIGSSAFIFLSLFFSSLLYAWIFGYMYGVFTALLLGLLGVVCFRIFQRVVV